MTRKAVWIDYTNWRGERRWRSVCPIQIVFESNEWHKECQWFLEAHDFDSREIRTFALSNIHEWRTQEPTK